MSLLVSICLPNLNQRRFLPARLDSIFQQTVDSWELIVSDNHSDDGAWEYLQAAAQREPRLRLSQAPREGMYANWNNCIRQARGEYLYVATSDDTMEPRCLGKLLQALESHPDCGIAYCAADFIDERGLPVTEQRWEDWPTTAYFGELTKLPHVRPPGHDAILAFALKTPYYSTTQVLVRRKLFAEAGLYENHWGSFADLEWQMRASLLTSTVFVPEKLATWRIHSQQASQKDRYLAAVRAGWFVDMADRVIEFSQRRGVPTQAGLPRRLRRFFLLEQADSLWATLPTKADRLRYLGRALLSDIESGWFVSLSKLPKGRSRPWDYAEEIRKELARSGIPAPRVCASDENRRLAQPA